MMTTVRDIFAFLNGLFPVETACDFDHVGLLVGDENAPVTNMMVALDCTPTVLDRARQERCELIVTHHPVIFDGLKTVLAGSTAAQLIKSGISVISMHTNMDVGQDGVNDQLCRVLGLENGKKINAPDGFLLRTGTLSSALSGDELAKFLQIRLGGRVKFVSRKTPIRQVLVCSGSGGSYLNFAAEQNLDALITADVKHDRFVEAQRLGIALFDAGHFETEDVITEPLAEKLRTAFPHITVLTDHTCGVRFV